MKSQRAREEYTTLRILWLNSQMTLKYFFSILHIFRLIHYIHDSGRSNLQGDILTSRQK